MRRVLFFLIGIVLWAVGQESSDVKVWSRIIFDIRLKEYRIYVRDPQLRELIRQIGGISLMQKCTDATLAIESRSYPLTTEECPPTVARLASDYRLFLKDRSAVGAFFWLKSRPTILFSAPRLRRFGLEVDKEMQQYMEDLP